MAYDYREQPVRCVLLVFALLTVTQLSAAEDLSATDPLDLHQTIRSAMEANSDVKIYQARVRAAESSLKVARTGFLPTFSAEYGYTRYDEPVYSISVVRPKEEYALVSRASQPLFAGFSIINQYKLSQLGLDSARINEALIQRETVFEAKRVYFSLLKAEKLEAVAQEAVDMLEAQTEVATTFHQAGMIPLNDLLKTKVELANAVQDHVVAQNGLEIARADFNLLLRRSIDTPIRISDILEPPPFPLTIQTCLGEAMSQRLEINVVDLDIEMKEREISLAKRDYYPTVTAQASYYQEGDSWQASGGEGIRDSSYWEFRAMAQWNFWQWGKTYHSVAEKKSFLDQSRLEKTNLIDEITREVKQAWLKADESRKNIVTVQSAITQAKEGYRVSEERYRQQMATSTDVLDARTQLSETMTRYYTALYDFYIATAALDRAIGRPNSNLANGQP